jgi:hypothetical protein
MNIVISQPMFFPWIGIFEQIRLANIYIHYDDVQLPQGRSFINRVQIKTKDGIKWLTVPLKRNNNCRLIRDAYISYDENWPEKHLKFLKSNFQKSPHAEEMISIVELVYKHKFETISQLNIYAIEEISKYFGLFNDKEFYISSGLNIPSFKSQHLLEIVIKFRCATYVTGWGAKNYIDYTLFESNNIDIQYMDYENKAYSQLYGEFTPFVSILDLIANAGRKGVGNIISQSKSHKIFIP